MYPTRERSVCLALLFITALLALPAAAAAERPALQVFSANQLLGAEVVDRLGYVGEIADVFYDPDQGVVSSVVIGFGRGPDGYEGFSVIPWDGIRFDGRTALMLDAADWNVRAFDPRPANGSRSLLKTLGLTAVDSRARPIGRIRSVMVDINSGVIAFVVVSLERIGYPDMLAAMPWQALKLLPASQTLQIMFEEEMIFDNAYKRGDKVDYNDPRFASNVYRAYETPRFWRDTEKRGAAGEGDDAEKKDDDKDAEEEESAWAPGSEFNSQFNPADVREYEGVIEGVEMFRPNSVSVRGIRFRLRGDRGQSIVVYAGPAAYTKRLGILWRYGTRVKVYGSPAKISGRDIVLAQEIQIDGLSVKFRDEDGIPLWQPRDLVAVAPNASLTWPAERERSYESRPYYDTRYLIQPITRYRNVYGGGLYNQYGYRISPRYNYYQRRRNVYGGGLYNRYGRRISGRYLILLDKDGYDIVRY